MRIGELAERTGLSLRTIRFYEEVGVLAPAPRTKGGFRLFTDGDLQRLLLARQMKPLGFSVEEMRDLVAAVEALTLDPADPAQARAVQLVRDYQIRVGERAAALHSQAANAQEFAQDLGALIVGRSVEVGR
jgi:DNA-binding transcriptional MerR regulator